jgi:hypothetical protein
MFLVDSSDGTNYTFTAANSSGFGLFAASSPNLVDDANGDEALDPSTTLAGVYPDGSPYSGAYAGTDKDLVLRDSSGQTYLLSATGSTGVPSGLMALPDGQSETVDGDTDISDGSDALWLFYETPTGTVTYMVVPNTPLDPPTPSPSLTISDTSVTEGNSGTTDAVFTVTLSAAQTVPVTVDYTTTPGTASSSSDFAAATGTLTFQPGETTKTIAVAVNGDTTFEPDEDFFVNLGSATNATVADGAGTATIVNDDAQPTASITADSGAVTAPTSGTTTYTFTVTLSNPSWQTITIDFATADGTATAGVDYEATNGTLTFAPGETTKIITVTIDTASDACTGGTFYVNLSDPQDATLSVTQATGTILHSLGGGPGGPP